MKLTVLGSSSAGNGYLFDNGKEALLVECGVRFSEIQKAVSFDISRIKGALISHEHGDHAKSIKKVLAAQIPCYMSRGTAEALDVMEDHCTNVIVGFKKVEIGGFSVQSFAVQHDAKEPAGFLIHHAETGWTLFATDTYYLKYKFRGLSNMLIECNYSLEILERNLQNGLITKPQRDRTLLSHMSLEACIDFLRASDLSRVCNLVLIHLSPSNSHAALFREEIHKATAIAPTIAEKGLTMEFNKAPF